jgi:hypothetical protein
MQSNITAKEREKLEVAISEEVQSQIDLFKALRQEDWEQVAKGLEENRPKIRTASDSFKKAVQILRQSGYEFTVRYLTEDDVTATMQPKKRKKYLDYEKATESVVAELKAIKRRTLMRLYTATGTDELMNELVAEIQKVVGEPARKTCPFCP